MLGYILVSLNETPRIANKKAVSIGFAFNRQADSVVSMSNGIHDCFVNRDIRVFRFFKKSTIGISPLIDFEESSLLKKSSHIAYLFGYRSAKSSFECRQSSSLGIFDRGFKAK